MRWLFSPRPASGKVEIEPIWLAWLAWLALGLVTAWTDWQ